MEPSTPDRSKEKKMQREKRKSEDRKSEDRKSEATGKTSSSRETRKNTPTDGGSSDHALSTGIKTEKPRTAVTSPAVSDTCQADNRYKWSYSMMTNYNMAALRKEFMKIKKYELAEYTSVAFNKHGGKNRYPDVPCIDSTRVVLKERSPDDDYIHANWVTMPDQTKYICTQGPIQETIVDFWHMIYTEMSPVIVMLCAFEEGKNEKCAVYYPKSKTERGKFGPYRIVLRETMPSPFNTIDHKIFTVKNKKTNSSIEVHHLACSEWPDHAAPLDPEPIVGMMKLARSIAKGKPITVHCSAGIGRSATFIGIDYAMQKIKNNSLTCMTDVLKGLRQQRFHSIQGIIQFIFLHICVLEAFAEEGFVDRKGKFAQYLADYVRMVNNFKKKMSAMQEEK